MRTLFASALAAALLAPLAGAQDQENTPNQPTSTPPPLTMPMGLKPPPGGAAGAATNSLKLIDGAIKDLGDDVQKLTDCAASIDYLKKDLAATKERLTAKGGGKIPSNQAGLVVLKIKRLGRQQQACLTESKNIDDHFTLAIRSIAGIQPPSHAGIPPRRLKILQLREKFTGALKRLGGKGGKAPAAGAGAAATEAAGEDSGQ